MDTEASTGMRENMIATAVTFLQNPKVRQSPFAQRRSFLERKGLTKEEIDEAITRSGTAADEQAVTSTVSPATQPAVTTALKPVSPWTKAKDYAATAIVVGGIGYALYQFYKRYLAPVWFGPSVEEKRMESIEVSVRSLQESVSQTLKAIDVMQDSVKKQQESLQQLVTDSLAQRSSGEVNKMQDRQYVTEIKDEIKSLKGLLLTRKQFPPTPNTKPVIPAWQLDASKTTPSSADGKQPSDEKPESNASSEDKPALSAASDKTLNTEDSSTAASVQPSSVGESVLGETSDVSKEEESLTETSAEQSNTNRSEGDK